MPARAVCLVPAHQQRSPVMPGMDGHGYMSRSAALASSYSWA